MTKLPPLLTFEPLADFILVLRDTPDTQTAAGIIIPIEAQDAPRTGLVVAAGHGTYQFGRFIPTIVEEGDRILFGPYCGSDITIDGHPLLVLRESDIIAIAITPDETPDSQNVGTDPNGVGGANV